mgnify:CR=1 FL=1
MSKKDTSKTSEPKFENIKIISHIFALSKFPKNCLKSQKRIFIFRNSDEHARIGAEVRSPEGASLEGDDEGAEG